MSQAMFAFYRTVPSWAFQLGTLVLLGAYAGVPLVSFLRRARGIIHPAYGVSRATSNTGLPALWQTRIGRL